MELSSFTSISKRLLRITRFIYMFRKRMPISKQKLVMDLHLFLDRRKVAGKTLYDHIITTTLHRRRRSGSAASSGATQPDVTKSYVPWDDVDYISCSKDHHQHGVANKFVDVGVAIAKALEMLNSEVLSDDDFMAVSPMVNSRKSPVAGRRVWGTDSPLPVTEEEEEGEVGSRVDREAEEFIQQFYDNLRRQQAVPDSP